MTATEFELLTKALFEKELNKKFETNIIVEHQKVFDTKDGYTYKTDLSFEFSVGGLKYLNIVECKYWDVYVSRMVLNTVQSTVADLKAHKGIVVSKRGFQKGAIAFAKKFGIALIKVTNDNTLEYVSHYDGNIEGYENFITTESQNSLDKDFSMVGIVSPQKDIYAFVTERCGKEFSDFLSNNDLLNYMDVWPVPKLDSKILQQSKKLTFELLAEYSLIETCGLPLKLTNEPELRKVNADIFFLKMI